MSLHIRDAEILDCALISKMGVKTFVDTYSRILPERIEMTKAYAKETFAEAEIRGQLSDKKIRYYIAHNNDEVVGYAKTVIGEIPSEVRLAPSIELEKIYLLETAKGKGFGKLFFEQLKSLARKDGRKSIWLAVYEDNFEATGFYRKLGFKEIGRREFKFSWQGADYKDIDVLMECEI
jgi:ribosomal protein S18 acetylase RimI-like enzyme